jgi:hypothetical protein
MLTEHRASAALGDVKLTPDMINAKPSARGA